MPRRIAWRRGAAVHALLVWSALATNASAQEAAPDSAAADDTPVPAAASLVAPVTRYVELSGEMGIVTELYAVRGRQARRPGRLAEVYLKPSLTAFGRLQLDFDVVLSTEQVSTNSTGSLGQLGVNPEWDWGRAHLGDFSESFTQLTLGGVVLRGVGVSAWNDRRRINTVMGYTQQASTKAGQQRYRRYLVGMQAGVGEPGKRALDLTFLRTADVISSVTFAGDSLLTDSLGTGRIDGLLQDDLDAQLDSILQQDFAPTSESFAVAPEDNMVLGAASALEFLDGRAVWISEVNTSFHTLDARAADASGQVPIVLDALFRERVSTSVDHAVDTGVTLRLASVQLQGGYRRLGPDYVSLGVGSLPVDQEQFRSKAAWSSGPVRLGLGGSFQHNNLNGAREATTQRRKVDADANWKINANWNAALKVGTATMRSDADDPAKAADTRSRNLGLTQQYRFARGGTLKDAGVAYALLRTADDRADRSRSATKHSINAQLGLDLTPALTAKPSVKWLHSGGSDEPESVQTTWGVVFAHTALARRLKTTLSASLTEREPTRALRGRLSATYRLSPSRALKVQWQSNAVRNSADATKGFDEVTASITLAQRF